MINNRRNFIKKSLVSGAGLYLLPGSLHADIPEEIVMTVNGSINPSALKFTLTHEHILVDFIGAEKYSKDRYNADEVFNRALPFLMDIKEKGCHTFIDCSPAYLGRDVKLLKRLADASGLIFITNTGYYGAIHENFLPKQVYTETSRQLADQWIAEFKDGIEGTGIKPGFIKTSVDGAPLTQTQRKIIEAAALTHLATGLTIAIHTDNGKAAKEELSILSANGVSPEARIWVHAQKEKDMTYHIATAKSKGWVSFEDVQPDNFQITVDNLKTMRAAGLLGRVLVSHDSGWYNVGQPNGGDYKNYNTIFTQLIPALKQNGFTAQDLNTIFVKNPATAFTIRVRKM